ncbi:MAG: sigma-70 family RNA polymerase sigma factor [Treponema sp.]|nr:sigma-70 family RNA polymerase sigma factor [Treponema sp.]
MGLEDNKNSASSQTIYPFLVENQHLTDVSSIDAAVIEDLYKYYSLVYWRCLEILRNREDAADAAHDVFEKLLRLREEGRLIIRSSEGPKGLLFTMARNMSFNRRKKENRDFIKAYSMATKISFTRLKNIKTETINDKPSDQVFWENVFTDSGYKQVDAEILVKAILEEEDEKSRDIYFLRYHDEMTFEQIGKVVGLGKSAVEKRLKEFKERVKLKIGKDKK